MKTSELTGAALDWAVATADGEDYYKLDLYAPSQLWEQGGAIIEREEISIESGVEWTAYCWIDKKDEQAYGNGKTPLEAAMRCYVASTLGDEVEIPELLAV